MPATEVCRPSGPGPRDKVINIISLLSTCIAFPLSCWFLIGLFVAPISTTNYIYREPLPVESVLSVISQPATCKLMLFRPQQIQSGLVYSLSISNIKPPGHALADVKLQDSGAYTTFNNTACDVGQAVRVTSLYSDGSCTQHQDACAAGEQASGLQTCVLMATQGITSPVISSEAWHFMGEASDVVSALSDDTEFTSGRVCVPGEPSFYFYIKEHAFGGPATQGKRCQEGTVVSPWPAIAHIWMWWLGLPLVGMLALIAVLIACLCVAECICSMTRSANVVPTSALEAGGDSSAPDVEMGALDAAEDDPETDSEKHPDNFLTAIS